MTDTAATPAGVRHEIRVFAGDLVAAITHLFGADPRRLRQRHVARLNRAHRVVADCWGAGEMVVRRTGAAGRGVFVWSSNAGPDRIIVADSARYWDRHGRPRPGRIARAVNRRVRLERDIRSVEPDWLTGETVDALNGRLRHVR